MKIFCLSIYNENFDLFENLNLVPVGLGNQNFDTKWLNDRGKINISEKNENFGEYTFHYHLWKNNLIDLNNNSWIGFCTYRRLWANLDHDKVINFNNLSRNILMKPHKDWLNFEVVLVKPLIFNKINNLKLIKKNLFEVIKKPKVLIQKTSLLDQFNIFHGSYFLNEAFNILTKENRDDFEKYLRGYELNPHNMFICKNSKILNKFYSEIFPWLFECEKIFKKKELKSYERKRIYGFLAERYMPYWFKKNFKVIEWPIIFFDTHLNV